MITRVLLAVVLVWATLGLGACATKPVEQHSLRSLRDRSARVERSLLQARETAVYKDSEGERSASLKHLSTLRFVLSAANISLIAVDSQLTKPEHRQVAYAVLDETLGTIEWNIPILPGSGQRGFPSLFTPQSSGLNFDAIRSGATPLTFAGPQVLPEQWGLFGAPSAMPGAAPGNIAAPPGFVR
ncbi:MAG: hypothetical protein MUE97_00975 [Phycisphaerales bacterium]|jgi:hypothetical protein|nr:hypothetical protein [Phycisphaerales bacterium]